MGGWKFPWSKKKKSKNQSQEDREAGGEGDTGAAVLPDPEPKAPEPTVPAEVPEVDAEAKADEAPTADAKTDGVEVDEVQVQMADPQVDEKAEPTVDDEEVKKEPTAEDEVKAEEPTVEEATVLETKEPEATSFSEATDEKQAAAPDVDEAKDLSTIDEEKAAPEDKVAADEPKPAEETVKEPTDEEAATGPAKEEEEPKAEDTAEGSTAAAPKPLPELPVRPAEEKKGLLARVFPRATSWSFFSKAPPDAQDQSRALFKEKNQLPSLAVKQAPEAPAKVEEAASGQVNLGGAFGSSPPVETKKDATNEPDAEATPNQEDKATGEDAFGADDHQVADEGSIQEATVAESVPFPAFAVDFLRGFVPAVPLIPMGFMTQPPPEPPRTDGKGGKGGAFPALQPIQAQPAPWRGSYVPPIVGGSMLAPVGSMVNLGSLAQPMGGYTPPVIGRQPSANITSSTASLGNTTPRVIVAAARSEGSTGSGVQRMASAPVVTVVRAGSGNSSPHAGPIMQAPQLARQPIVIRAQPMPMSCGGMPMVQQPRPYASLFGGMGTSLLL